jgi:hypothetical protein
MRPLLVEWVGKHTFDFDVRHLSPPDHQPLQIFSGRVRQAQLTVRPVNHSDLCVQFRAVLPKPQDRTPLETATEPLVRQ